MPELKQYTMLESYSKKVSVKMTVEGKGLPLEYPGFKDFCAYIADYFTTNADLLPKDDDEDINFMERYIKCVRSGEWNEAEHCWTDKAGGPSSISAGVPLPVPRR
jgi:hypothetical protein